MALGLTRFQLSYFLPALDASGGDIWGKKKSSRVFLFAEDIPGDLGVTPRRGQRPRLNRQYRTEI